MNNLFAGKPMSAWYGIYQHSMHPLRYVALGLVALLYVGCPTFEDEYTGTYREFEFGEEQDEAIEVDFFRFGSDARAVVRYYKRSALSTIQSPFSARNQTRCAWTQVDAFQETTRSFILPILPSARRPRETVYGFINSQGIMELRIIQDSSEEEPREVLLQRTERRADARCENINDFLVRPDFEREKNSLPAEDYTIEHPVFAVMWVGVEPFQKDGAVVYVAFNRPEPTTRLESGANFTPKENALRGTLAISIPPPDERMLVRSGQTRYALAHFLVIDDMESEGRFAWDVNTEPIIASALQRGKHPDGPDDSNGWGKALLFVEGKITDLDNNLRRRIEGINRLDEMPDSNFYIVDVFFYNDEIVRVKLPEDPLIRRLPMQVTDAYLNTSEILLPRLFPYQ